jgi:cobalamin transport system substrate-binding protein
MTGTNLFARRSGSEGSRSGILTCGSLPFAGAFPRRIGVTFRRLPAYSGATVPVFHRLPVHASSALLRYAGKATCPAYRRRVPLARALALVAVLALSACAAAAPAHPDIPQRIVSLIPSLTEDLFAIGAGPAVVGVSAFTDYPPAAAKLPVVANVSGANVERIVMLHPDVVVGIASQTAPAADIRRAGIRTVLLKDDDFEDIFRDIEALGLLSGHDEEGRALTDRLRARTLELMRTVRKRARPLRVFVVLGTGPIFTAGDSSYVGKLIALAGGANAALIHDAYGAYSAEALVAVQPDVLVADSTVQLQSVLDRPPWNALRAVREHRVAYLPDPAILERPGPRYNDGLAWLIGILNNTHV